MSTTIITGRGMLNEHDKGLNRSQVIIHTHGTWSLLKRYAHIRTLRWRSRRPFVERLAHTTLALLLCKHMTFTFKLYTLHHFILDQSIVSCVG